MSGGDDWPDSPLVSVQTLSDLIADGSALVFDCRFDLAHPSQGRQSYLSAHLPGAFYANLDTHLSGRITRRSGRHPLPLPKTFASFLARAGYTAERKVVAYDAQGGAFAARLWWLMQYFGLGRTAVLDGGIGAWMATGLRLESGEAKATRQPLPELRSRPELTLGTQDVISALDSEDILLLDARAANRFRGEDETIDPVAGHVPGAVNRPFSSNLAEDGRFRPPAELRSEFRKLLGKHSPGELVHMCGSGVTASHNVLAMELAGMPGSKLYPESWSGWISDPQRPVTQGAR